MVRPPLPQGYFFNVLLTELGKMNCRLIWVGILGVVVKRGNISKLRASYSGSLKSTENVVIIFSILCPCSFWIQVLLAVKSHNWYIVIYLGFYSFCQETKSYPLETFKCGKLLTNEAKIGAELQFQLSPGSQCPEGQSRWDLVTICMYTGML